MCPDDGDQPLMNFFMLGGGAKMYMKNLCTCNLPCQEVAWTRGHQGKRNTHSNRKQNKYISLVHVFPHKLI